MDNQTYSKCYSGKGMWEVHYNYPNCFGWDVLGTFSQHEHALWFLNSFRAL